MTAAMAGERRDLEDELAHWKRTRRLASKEHDHADAQVRRLERMLAAAGTPEERRAAFKVVAS